jgi:V/A-type H+-transporting ATPase subunit E
MPEDLNGLLEKIRRDGVEAAQAKAREIEAEAARRAEEKIRSAEKEAARMIEQARAEIAKAEAGGRQSLKQASRDTLISLHQAIASSLERIVSAHVHKALGAEEMTRIILALVKEAGCASREKTVISLRKEDLEKIEKPLLAELGNELRKGITLRHSAEIKGGFTISYDSGKSYYDFTDRALAEYIAAYLKPQLAKILEEAAS